MAMATINELAQAVAEAEGMDLPTVALIARYLREAGLIQKKGRGASAAQMNVADAANLLIAVNASGAAQDSALVVPIYRELVITRSGEKFTWVDSPPAFGSPPASSKISGTFGDAFELLVQSAVEGKLPNAILSQEVPSALQDAFQKGAATISIYFTRPEPRVHVSITGERSLEDKRRNIFRPPQINFSFQAWRGRLKRAAHKLKIGDRVDETKIGTRTITSVAKILRPRPEVRP
jgi:hypothetical protein